jgi:AcrR family transcriptional regulator
LKQEFNVPDAADLSVKSDGAVTQQLILDAALRILGRAGMPGLTARAIAAEAGTNLALVNYYFGSKQNLLLALSDALDSGKYARQRSMYDEPGVPLSVKWREAVAFYRQDVADGFVRVNTELHVLGFSNPEVAERARARLNRWRALLEQVAAAYLPALGIAAPPQLVVNALVCFWLGMDLQLLSGFGEEDGSFFAMLDYVGDWLEARERRLEPLPDTPAAG